MAAEEEAQRELEARKQKEELEIQQRDAAEKALLDEQLQEREERRQRLKAEYEQAQNKTRRGSVVSIGSILGTVGRKHGQHVTGI